MANTKEEIQKQYQNEASTYRDTVRLVNFDIANLFPLYLNILNTLYQDHNAPINILDIGAGDGLLTELVLSSYPNAHITLLDFSEEMLSSAKTHFSNNPNITYLKGDFIEGQLPKEEFDLVISSYAVHHTRNEEELTTLFLGETLEERQNQVEKAISKWQTNFNSLEKALEWAKIIKEEDTPSTLPRIISSLHKSSSNVLPLLMPNSDSLATIYGMTKLSLSKIRDLGLYDYVNSWAIYIPTKGNHIYETTSLPFEDGRGR